MHSRNRNQEVAVSARQSKAKLASIATADAHQAEIHAVAAEGSTLHIDSRIDFLKLFLDKLAGTTKERETIVQVHIKQKLEVAAAQLHTALQRSMPKTMQTIQT